MSALIKLAIRLNIACIMATIVNFGAAYFFNLGDWRVFGFTVWSLFAFFLLASLLISFLQDAFFKPSFENQTTQLAKQALNLSVDDASFSSSEIQFASNVIDAIGNNAKRAYRIAAVLAIVVYFIVGPNFGSPTAEIVALLILLAGPTAIKAMTFGTLDKMSRMNPDLFEVGRMTRSQMGNANFGI